MYGGTVIPLGWELCDGETLDSVAETKYADLFSTIGTTFGGTGADDFQVPDMRGIFPSGAGTSGKLNKATGGAFARTLGTYQEDRFQGHHHKFTIDTNTKGTQSGQVLNNQTGTAFQSTNAVVIEATNDPSYGTHRDANETRPANLGLNFIIKY